MKFPVLNIQPALDNPELMIDLSSSRIFENNNSLELSFNVEKLPGAIGECFTLLRRLYTHDFSLDVNPSLIILGTKITVKIESFIDRFSKIFTDNGFKISYYLRPTMILRISYSGDDISKKREILKESILELFKCLDNIVNDHGVIMVKSLEVEKDNNVVLDFSMLWFKNDILFYDNTVLINKTNDIVTAAKVLVDKYNASYETAVSPIDFQILHNIYLLSNLNAFFIDLIESNSDFFIQSKKDASVGYADSNLRMEILNEDIQDEAVVIGKGFVSLEDIKYLSSESSRLTIPEVLRAFLVGLK
jgi:hypothetical protein